MDYQRGVGTIDRKKDTIYRQAAIDLVKDVCDAIMSGCDSHYDSETGDEVYNDILEVDAILKCNKEIRIALVNMPSAEPERWSTCFDCPLSHGCPVIKGCTNEQAMQYAGEIPDDCPLNKISEESDRQTGEWILKKELVPLPWDSDPLNWDNYDKDTHSEWKEYYHCSNCDWKSGEFKDGNYCKNCGTKMDTRGKEDDDK